MLVRVMPFQLVEFEIRISLLKFSSLECECLKLLIGMFRFQKKIISLKILK